ncbi:MAG: translocation/assembly module TamB domain-containing protein [Rhizobiaceae bacterium]
MKLVRRILRIAGRLLILLVALGAGAVAVLTLTGPGRERLAAFVSSVASTPESGVRIGGLSGIWGGPLTIDHLVLTDVDGPWLVARGVEIEFSKLALLGSTFRAERLAARRIELARLPKAGASDGEGGLPVSIEIGGFEFPDIALGTLLVGDVAGIAASGSASAASDLSAIVAKAIVQRTDGKAGRVDLAVDFDSAAERLDVDVVANEPSGGVIAGLLGLPGMPSVDLVVSGSGPATKWSGKGTFAIDGETVTSVSATHSLTNRGRRVEARGDGLFERFLPESVRQLAAGSASFDFAGTLLADGGIDVDRASLKSAAVTASAHGSINPESGNDFALELSAAGAPVRLTFGAGQEPVALFLRSAALRAFGPGATPMVDAVVSLAELSLPGHRFETVELSAHSDAFETATMTGPVELTATAESGGSVNDTVAALLAGAIRAEVVAEVGTDKIVVRSGRVTTGTVEADLAGEAARDGSSVTAAIDGSLASAALPGAARPVLGDRVDLEARVTRTADGNLVVEGLDMKSAGLALAGSATLAGDDVRADLTGSLADVATLSPAATGAMTFAAKVNGPITAANFAASLEAERIEAAGRAITGLELTAEGVADPARPIAAIKLTGDVGGARLTGSADVVTENGRRLLREIAVSLGENRITGLVDFDTAWTPEGDVTLDLPDIAPLAALVLEEAAGSAKGSIQFRRGTTPSLTLDMTSTSVRRGDLIASGLDVSASVEDYFSAPTVSGRIRAGRVLSGGADIGAVDVTLARDGGWTAFSGAATVNAIPATATGRIRSEGGTTTIELAGAEATVVGLKAALARASTVTIAGGVTTLDNMAISAGGGTSTVSGTIADALALDVQLGGMPAGAINKFAPGLGAAGTITGTVRVSGPPSDPIVGYALDWKRAETSQTREAGFGAMAINSTGTFQNRSLAFKASIGDGSGLSMSGRGTVALSGGPRISVEFGGKVPFGFLTRRLAAQGLSLGGVAEVSLTLSGAAAAPTVSGTVRSSGARLVDARSGIAINDIGAAISIGAGVATIRSLTGVLSTGGSIAASGTVGIDGSKGFPADLTLALTNGRYTDGKLVTASLSGRLALSGSLVDFPLLSGTIDLGKTVITVPETLPASLSRLGVQHRNAPAAVQRQDEALRPAEGSGGGGGLRLDIALSAPQQIFVQGRGLDAELGGTLRLTGTSGAPQATGDFTLRRGRLALLGRRLDFTRGTLSFSGSMIPYIDLAADSRVGDSTVSVLVSGFADNPKFSFSSTPMLPEDEILARLTFGRSMSNLSPLQIAQLAQAAAQLAGVGGSTSLLDTLRSKLGVDDLDVKTDDATGDTAVSAGKYLNDRTYVTIEKGEKAGSGKATIDLDVGRGVKLRGEAGEDGRAKGGIFFEREY